MAKSFCEKQVASRKRRFLKEFRKTLYMKDACQRAGINPSTLHRWRRADADFEERFNLIQESKAYEMQDALFRGIEKGSESLIKFYLQHHGKHLGYGLEKSDPATAFIPAVLDVRDVLREIDDAFID